MRIDEHIKLDYHDVLLRPKRSTLRSRKDVVLERTFSFYHSPKKWTGLPIMTANMATCGTFGMAEELSKYKIITTFHKYYSVDDYKKFFKKFDNPDYVCYTLGIREEDIEKIKKMKKAKLMENFSFICIDVPNGYLQRFLESVKMIREMFPKHIIIAGNVVTNEMTEEIILAGADIVKIGIGPGSACTTRRMTGVGYPQLSAVIECADAAHGVANDRGVGRIIADGGQQYISDIAKAFCGGADFNMCGSLFSGFAESDGELVEKNGQKYKEYFGSSSNKAMSELYGKKDSHRASEGRYALIPYKGEIKFFIQDLLGSLRSTATYIGARQLKEFPKRATFIKTNRQLTTYLEQYDTGQ
ncbi:MAG TPA: GMP reductase [Candidatus Paceibacterota bacterium]|nr:GMP reductase [Candidatus Paceibacterota bacterium]HMP18896.1 GMP reductase [Candidatus Paceibacterota bacterium]HMP85057.1 GMP reductase [Candidatus Paceibacterota bacterium]